ncbi:MAG: energy-coupling factor transporter transmembrane protein EcfT [Anaerolineales bacterium]|nr:energy-coupling factor transporter transmembrane protein EcfT [Anaerolineales bacterium]
MRKKRSSRRKIQPGLVEISPLRRRDPRTKIALALCASLAVMLPLEKLLIALTIYVILLQWGRLIPAAAQQIWRMKWILLFLFIGDWLLVSLDLAIIVTLRLILLTGSFALFFSTTTPAELRLALEWLHVPYRYAFSLGLAFMSINLLDKEWQAIKEAQYIRGAWSNNQAGGKKTERVRDLVSLSVPAVVLATKRAWSMTEAAHARGFDSPKRQSFRQLDMEKADYYLLFSALILCIGLLFWR